MTDRDRFVRCLTGEPVDRPPYWLFWSPWRTTWERWEREGKPRDVTDHSTSFGVDGRPRVLPVNCGPCPRIDRQVLEWLGLSQEEFAAGLKEHGTDEAMIEWLGERLQKSQEEIEAFNRQLQTLGPSSERASNFLRGVIASVDASRREVASFCALTVIEDRVFFARHKADV